jgi:hypothetical protein
MNLYTTDAPGRLFLLHSWILIPGRILVNVTARQHIYLMPVFTKTLWIR